MSPTHRLVILRHAKSSWSTGVLDHKRPLNERGLRDSVAAGQWLAGNIGEIDHVLCSDATINVGTRPAWWRNRQRL